MQQGGSWRNERAHQAIIDREIFEAAQQVLGERGGARAAISQDYYYLRGAVVCLHCGCSCTPYSAKSRSVHYYACLYHLKKKSTCPVKWVNADALHASVLREIERAARHRTVMHKLIAQWGGWSNASDAQRALRGQLDKRLQMVEMRIGNYVKAVGEGRTSEALFVALDEAEEERRCVREELAQIQTQIELATMQRPTVDEIREVWSQVVDLWEHLTPGEGTELLGAIVKRVEIKEKSAASMQLSPIAEGRAQEFLTHCQMGAAVEVIANNYATIRLEAAVVREYRTAA